ncbi:MULTISPECIES: translocation/assembly module TamB domain-containing protein [unclassified Moraxella]|uniref:translocation/assembly module TamB domain-containing protein n=1 Tax=unclassified Moraxella TaxID=2685852 RepID=UPI003AF8518A
MTHQTDPNKDDPKNHDNTEIVDGLDPAERDARWLRRWYPLGFVTKIGLVIVLLLILAVIAIYYALGTPWGTQLLIKTVTDQTGISLKYGKGNVRDGLWVYDLKIPATPPKNYTEVTVDQAYVKVGWKAILSKQVHLREATIHNMVITYKKPPSNRPFDYKKIALPVNLTVDKATANLVRYQQVTREPIDFKQADIKDFSWQDSEIQVGYAKLGYNELFTIDNLKGKIDLQHDYPLTAQGDLAIHALNKVHFDTLNTKVTGSLKQLNAELKSRYNHADISGHLTTRPLEKGVPFDAKVQWQDVLLPYASEQNIHLKQGELIASGPIDDIQLQVDTDLTAKDIPDGHYQGRASTNGKKLDIQELVATLPEGQLVSQGTIDWQNHTRIALTNTSQNFHIRKLLSSDIAPYAPAVLNGKLAVVYDVATDKLPMQLRANLRQNDGEVVNADISKAKANTAPYQITANWQHLIRKNLPNVGDLNSPNGNAKVNYYPSNGKQPPRLQVDGRANILQLNIAPQGDYQVKLNKLGQIINLEQVNYQGKAGDLAGTGKIELAYANRPLVWQLNANTHGLNAHQILDNIPFDHLKGTLNANGTMHHVRQAKGVRLTKHQIQIRQVDMTGTLLGENNSNKNLAIKGTGNVTLDVVANQLSYMTAKFNGNLNAPNVPAGAFKVDIAGTPKNLQINQFSHQGATGNIDAKGKLDLTRGVAWQINANMNNFDASYFVPSLPSRISGRINTDGHWRDDEQYIHINDMNLQGVLKNQPLSATGQLTARLHLPKDLQTVRQSLFNSPKNQQYNQVKRFIEQLQANNLVMAWGNNRLTANGNQNQLITSVDISTLNQLNAKLKGTLKGGLVLSQPNQSQALPDIYVDLVARNIALPNFVVLDATLKGKLVNMAKSPSQLQLNATGLNIANQPLRALQLYFDGTQASHTMTVKTDSSRGQLQATLKGRIDLNKSEWQGVVGNGQIGTKYAKLQQLQPAQLLLNWQKQHIQLASHCWQMVGQQGNLCLQDNLVASASQGQVNLVVKNLDSRIFGVVMPNDIVWSGSLNGNALINWKKNQRPTVNASFYSDNGIIGTTAQDPQEDPTTVAYQRISIIARSMPDGLKLRADVKTPNGAGNGYLDATINPYGQNKPIGGTVVFQDINLAVLKPFFPSFERLTGTGLVAGKIDGTLDQPKFVGDIELLDASLGITGVPMRFDKINVLSHVEGNQAQVTGDFVSAGDGKGIITGTVNWAGELQAKLKLQGERLLVSQPPTVTAEINPIFDVIVRPTQRYVNIVGVIDVPRATIRPPEATTNVITKSSDVNVIDRRLLGQINEVLRVAQPWSINADIGVDLGDNISFQGFGARLPLAGALHLTQQGQGSMQAQGVVQVAKRSKVEIFGQSLNLDFAQVRFNGNVAQPTLNIQAVKEVQGVQVGLKVKGKTSKPDILVFNNGGLSEQQAMNALVTGSLNNTTGQNTNEQEFSNRVNNTLAAAGLSYGLSGTRRLTNQIGRAFGLQSLTLDANGTGNDTLVSITGYITPDLFIRYGVGVFTAQPELSMRYQLTRRLYVEAKSAVNNSVDLIYNWRY